MQATANLDGESQGEILNEIVEHEPIPYDESLGQLAYYLRKYMIGKEKFPAIVAVIALLEADEGPPSRRLFGKFISELLKAGFDTDFINGYFMNYTALPEEDIRDIIERLKNEDVVSVIDDVSSFMGRIISELSSSPDWASYVTDRLVQLGFDQHFIDSYIIYPSGRPRISIFTGRQLPIAEVDRYWVMGSIDPVLISDDWIGKTVILAQDTLIPVVRYGGGMQRKGKGLFNPESNESYCGRFYYYEPNSSVLLTCNKILITPNKITACIHLLGRNETYNLLISNLDAHSNYVKEEESSDTEQSRYFYTGYWRFGGFYPEIKDDREKWNIIFDAMTNGTYPFLTHKIGSYAAEDKLDQVICREAKNHNLDVILLTTMTGKNRIVTEVCDARDDSYEYLVTITK